ncbi:hypothetical protein CO663_36295, partial [Rhizobium anhuiense]
MHVTHGECLRHLLGDQADFLAQHCQIIGYQSVPTSDARPYTTCYNRFVRWRKAGVWDHVLREI